MSMESSEHDREVTDCINERNEYFTEEECESDEE